MSIFLQNYVQLLQSARNKPLQPVISGGVEVMREGDYVVSLGYMQAIIIVLTIVLMVIFDPDDRAHHPGARSATRVRAGQATWRR